LPARLHCRVPEARTRYDSGAKVHGLLTPFMTQLAWVLPLAISASPSSLLATPTVPGFTCKRALLSPNALVIVAPRSTPRARLHHSSCRTATWQQHRPCFCMQAPFVSLSATTADLRPTTTTSV